MSKELKTLKDIEKLDMKERAFANSIRKEAVKWVKEDIEYLKTLAIFSKSDIINRWAKRFNLTEDDLQ